MSKIGGYLFILLVLKLINILTARPPVKPSDEIYFDMEEQINTAGRVVFPSEDEETNWNTRQDILKPVVKSSIKPKQQPTCTEEDNFCEDIATYPYVHLTKILQTNTILRDVFENKHVEEEMTKRMDNEDTFLCPSVVKTVFPKLGKNRQKMWKYIINQDEFVQSIRVEVCRSDGAPCDLIHELPSGYTTACEQKYIYTRLLSLDTKGSPIVDVFPLPSACACAYKRDMNFFARIGNRLTPKGSKRTF